MNETEFMRATNCSQAMAREWAPLFLDAFEEFGITDRLDRAMILGIATHESDRFRSLVETFNYSSGALRRKFGSRFSPYQSAMLGFQMLEREIPQERQKAIANLAYGGRNGNGSREGWEYRARGVIPVRSKKFYCEAGELVGLDLAERPDDLAKPEVAARVACALFKARGCCGAFLDDVEKKLGLEPLDLKNNPRNLAYRRARAELPR